MNSSALPWTIREWPKTYPFPEEEERYLVFSPELHPFLSTRRRGGQRTTCSQMINQCPLIRLEGL